MMITSSLDTALADRFVIITPMTRVLYLGLIKWVLHSGVSDNAIIIVVVESLLMNPFW